MTFAADIERHFLVVGVVGGLQHEGRHRREEHDLGDRAGPVPSDVSTHLTTPVEKPTGVVS
ncbi:hypothetical protein [Rhodococcus sp. WB9]|uniref:hypothetical protein n=1 Tax=Rhodococcus sp. WB9 TaxID=2594007 RepID=UPI0016432F36|nr:hypothetical protein [Rhodococcus sp. WB9]